MKKHILFLLGTLFALPAIARDITYTYEGQSLTYTVISEEGKTVMTKAGESDRIAGNNVSGNLIIPSAITDSVGGETYTVTSLGENAFAGCRSLTSVTIPNSIKSIGSNAFYNCSGLTSVTFSDSVASIGNLAFYGCIRLTSVTIPDSVTSIGDFAFYGCTGLTSVRIENSVSSIGYWAFLECTGLTKAEFASIESICNCNFGNGSSNPLYYANHLYINSSEIKDLVIPESVTSIGGFAFAGGRSLTSVSIPNSVTSIGIQAFSSCWGLTSVYYNAEEPVTLPDETCFDDRTYKSATLYVPDIAVDKCRQIKPWENFRYIQKFKFNGMENIIGDIDRGEPCEVYNFGGIKVSDSTENLAPGFYIVRQGSAIKKIAVNR